MKKTLRILASAVLAASMLFAVGCAKDAPLDLNEVKKWGGDININQAPRMLRIAADDKDGKTNLDVESWCITDKNGVILPENYFKSIKTVTVPDEKWVKHDVVNSKFGYGEKIPHGTIVQLEFPETVTNDFDVIVWISENKPEKYEDVEYKGGDLTFRGSVNISPTTGTHLKASKYSQVVKKVGIVTITCDETSHANKGTTTKTPGTWHGTYDIEEVWPLIKNSTTGKYTIMDNLKIKANIKEGETKQVIYPNGAEYIAVSQPNRFDPEKATGLYYSKGRNNPTWDGKDYKKAEAQAKKTQANWYWCVKTDTKSPKIKTSACTLHFDLTDGTFSSNNALRAGIPPIVVVDESFFVDGADLK